MDTDKKFSSLTIALHWLVAIGCIGLIALGIYMVNKEAWHLYHWHKSIGIMLFVVIIVRVVWRMKNGLPQPAAPASPMAHQAAKAAHRLLLICTLAMPLFGMLYSGASGHGFGIFGLELLPNNPDPAKPGQVIPLSSDLATLGQSVHSWLGYFLLVLVVLHVAAALKHHLFDRDGTLVRMLGTDLRQRP